MCKYAVDEPRQSCALSSFPHQVVNDLNLNYRIFLPAREATLLEQTEGFLTSVQ